MTSIKPRIIKRGGVWVVAGEWVTFPSGVIMYCELGVGKTPKQAWDKAFPRPWWGRLAFGAGKKLFDVLMDKRIKENNERYNKHVENVIWFTAISAKPTRSNP